jgi:hypothetical protein
MLMINTSNKQIYYIDKHTEYHISKSFICNAKNKQKVTLNI